MKAIVVNNYGGPEVLEYKDAPEPRPGPEEVLLRVAATSVNPIDLKRRSGVMKAFMPIRFPGVLGVDVAGTVLACGKDVQGFVVGDRVFGMGDHTYAELCVVQARNLAKIPAGLDLVEAAALPLATTTGYQLISTGAAVQRGQWLLVTGALGTVGRTAVFIAKAQGAKVIAGVRKTRIKDAVGLGADAVVPLDDSNAIASLRILDAVADAVNGPTAELLLGKVKDGGIFASVLGPPRNSADYSAVKMVYVISQPDPEILLKIATAVLEGKLAIPIARRLPLKDAALAHDLMAKGIDGKILLIP